MEKKLQTMFEYQRFDPSSKLAKMISRTEGRYARAISDDELEFVAAAGSTAMQEERAKKEQAESNSNLL